tara:strand:- start:1975 stop:2382 length:408 start_codon:yes stop_codon:yes gene_type:complete
MIRKITNPIFQFSNLFLNSNKGITNIQRLLVLLVIAIIAAIIGTIISEIIPLIGITVVIILFLIWFLKLKMTTKYESNMTIYNTKIGSKIFATGSMQWCWGLDNYNVPNLRKDFSSESAEIITRNLLKNFGATLK